MLSLKFVPFWDFLKEDKPIMEQPGNKRSLINLPERGIQVPGNYCQCRARECRAFETSLTKRRRLAAGKYRPPSLR